MKAAIWIFLIAYGIQVSSVQAFEPEGSTNALGNAMYPPASRFPGSMMWLLQKVTQATT